MEVGFFKDATNVLIEVEIAPARKTSFSRRYREMTGGPPVDRYMTVTNKWGAECRIYFDAPDSVLDELAHLGLKVNAPPEGRYTQEYRVNSAEFFWALVAAGYRLGEN